MGYQPAPGFEWNPMKNYPRNAGCPCRSGKKFKKCCIDRVPEFIPNRATLEEAAAAERMKKKNG